MDFQDFFDAYNIPYYNFWYFIKDSTHKKTPTGGFNKNDSLQMIDTRKTTFTNKRPLTYYDYDNKTTETFSEVEEHTIKCAFGFS